NLFGNKILTEGDTQIKARGTLDWGTMQETDFVAEVEAAGLGIPVAHMEGFRAVVTGAGPLVSVKEATFGLYQGSGQGEFSILLDPKANGMPYEMDVKVEGADFRKCLKFLRPEVDYKVSGVLSGNVHFEADMTRGFFETANGDGSLRVEDGQLADLPFFSGFSRLMRKVIPGFNVFSITSLSGTFVFEEGVVRSPDAYFAGDVICAKAKGSYSKKTGFDALVQGQVLSNRGLSKLVRVITDPIFKFFEFKLGGALSEPSWRLEKLPGGTRPADAAKEGSESG
ncbi:MAG: AsmA-like C-terminal region-containing protein, partial [Verrucomicrobiota bacterium]|nr:AsmA-like C-terminal region-containing protein [Verrucomicrobiota bacterium]